MNLIIKKYILILNQLYVRYFGVETMKKQVFVLISLMSIFVLLFCGGVTAAELNDTISNSNVFTTQNIIKTTTDENGDFTFDNLSNQTHVIWINQDELPEKYRNNNETSKIALILSPNSSSTTSIRSLTFNSSFKEGNIVGKLYDSSSMKGLPGITVYDPPQIKIVEISDSVDLKQEVPAAHQLMIDHPELLFILRDHVQLSEVSKSQLMDLISQSDILLLKIKSVDLLNIISNIFNENPEIFENRTIHGKGSECMGYSKIAGIKIFEGFSSEQMNTIHDRISNAKDPVNEILKIKSEYPSDHPIVHWLNMKEFEKSGGSHNFYNAYLYLLNTHTGNSDYSYNSFIKTPKYFIYHNGKTFDTFQAYQSFIDPQKPTVGIFGRTTVLYGAGETLMVDALIKEFEKKGMNVLTVMGAYGEAALTAMQTYFLDQNGNSRIDVLISLESLMIGGSDANVNLEVVNLFEKLNVTVLSGLFTNRVTPEEWMISDKGLELIDVYKSITMPEVQGINEPILIAAQKNELDELTGALLRGYVVIPDRIEKLSKRALNWIKLRNLFNSDKKLAIIYYNNPPGKNSIGASYLAVPASIVEILERLKCEGYSTGEIPNNADELVNIMLEKGINVASWAPGVLEEYADKAILWDADEYIAWFNKLNPITQKQTIEGPIGYIEEITKFASRIGETNEIIIKIDKWKLDMVSTINDVVSDTAKSQNCVDLIYRMVDSLKATVNGNSTAWNDFYLAKNEFLLNEIPALTGWGEAPGNLMTVIRDGKQYIAIPGTFFGNIFIGPEPLRGFEADNDKLFNSPVITPPHQFLAVYAWLETVFGVNAEIHLGTYARFEWTPGKQTALANYDYPDIVIGNVPSPYIYIVDNIALGLQAKRRGLSVLINHLTPPIKTTELYSELLGIRNLLEQYYKSDPVADAEGRRLILDEIKEKIKILNMGTDLGIDINTVSDSELTKKTSDYLLELQETFMPYGLHTFGERWSNEEIATMLYSISSVDIELGNDQIKSLPRLIAMSMGLNIDSITFLQKEEINIQAEELCRSIVAGSTPEDLAAQLTSDAELINDIIKTLNNVKINYNSLILSFDNEINSLINCLNGGYVKPGPGNDPIRSQEVLPTGRNTYSIQETVLPTRTAYILGSSLATQVLSQLSSIPEKIAAVLWAAETARDDGVMLSFILNMMGVKVTYSKSGSRNGVVAIPLSELGRERVDVVVTTSGLFRDLYGRLLTDVLDRGTKVALATSYNSIIERYPEVTSALDSALKTIEDANLLVKGNDPIEKNYIAKHWIELVQNYTAKGISPDIAGEMATTRIFTSAAGNYGNRVMSVTEQAWTWEERMQISDLYIEQMKYSYTESGWGNSNVDLFKDLLKGVSNIYHSRSSNLHGTLDNDEFLQYLGGLSMAVERINGVTPDAYVLSYANRANSKVETLQHVISKELRSRYFNPEWIEGMMNEGYSGAKTVSQTITNLWGWEVTTPHVVENWMWNEMVDTYVKDKYNTGITKWLSSGNNVYSMISFTGTLLTAAHKGSWQTDSATLTHVAQTWANLIAQNGVACCDCSCGNIAMMEWASQHVNPDLLSHLNAQLYKATHNPGFAPSSTPSQPEYQSSSVPQSQGLSSQLSSQSMSRSTDGDGEQSQSEESLGPGDQGESKAYEVSKQGISSSSDSGLPIVAVIGVIALVCLIGLGYFRKR